MTTLVKEVASNVSEYYTNFKDRICNDGHFCDDLAMTLLATVTIWMMIEAMRPSF